MPLPRIVPVPADLTQDIAGPVPVDLLHSWAGGPQDETEAGRLLNGFKIARTVAAIDTSGHTRMSGERDLLDVLALISEPKHAVHGLGVAIGGRAVGIWIADNTEMYYPPGLEPELVVNAITHVAHRTTHVAHRTTHVAHSLRRPA